MTTPDRAFEAATSAKVSRRLIPLLFVAYIAAHLDPVSGLGAGSRRTAAEWILAPARAGR